MMATATLREDLVQRLRNVLARYHDTRARVEEELATREIEDVDRATEQWDARVLSVLGRSDLEELARLAAAIRKIDEGTYGTCSKCGGEIEPARLRALPMTTSCFDCAFTEELTQRVSLGR